MTSAARAAPTDLTRFYALFPQPALASDLFNIVEGHRVDTLIRRAYPGIRRDMTFIRSATADRRPDLATLPDAQAIVEALLQHALGVEADMGGLAPHTARLARAAMSALDELEVAAARVADSARLAARLYELIDDGIADPRRWMGPEEGEAPPPPGADGQAPEEAAESGVSAPGVSDYESVDLPPFMTPVLEELVRQQQEQARGAPPGAAEPEGEEKPEGGEVPADAKAMRTSEARPGERQPGDEVAQSMRRSQVEQAPAPPAGAADSRSDDAEGGSDSPLSSQPVEVPLVAAERDEDDLGEQVFHYDEWDHKIEDYRPSWCTLREQRATRTQEGFVAAAFHEFGGIVSQIRRNFQLMRPERLRKMRHQREGDDLDVDGLVEYVVDRRARVAPTERVYVKRDKKDRDVTTAFLVDMSSSTDRKIDGRKRIIDIEKEALLLMCEALEAIRDEYAIYGFSGCGARRLPVLRGQGARASATTIGSRAASAGSTAARRPAWARPCATPRERLMGVDSNIKLLILLTDGKPYDSDTYQDNAYAQEDTKMALREARREKIHLFCVTVDREAADYLPHMYSDANFVIIDDVRTLPQKLPQLYRRLTT